MHSLLYPIRRWWPLLGYAVVAVPAWGQEAAEQTATKIPASPYEPGLMLLSVTVILVSGLAILRALRFLRLIQRPIWILPLLAFLTFALWLFLRIGRFADVPHLSALVGFLLAFLVFISILLPLAQWVVPSREQQTRGGMPVLLRGMAVVILACVGLFVLLSWAFPSFNFTPVFVTSGIVSIVLGLALQELLSNLFAGIVMSVERPYKIGDWISVGQVEGEVLEQTWRATMVRTRVNDCVLIPNTLVTREVLVNHDRPTSDFLVKLHVGVAYETPCGTAIDALLDAASRVEEVLKTPASEVFLKDFQDSAILYELRVWIDNYRSLHAIENEVRKQIWYSFKRHGVTIAFPQRDVNLRQVIEPLQAPSYRLVVTGGPLRGTMFPLQAAPVTIGRAADNTITVADLHVSNRHASIEPQKEGCLLRDLGSRYGTLLNGQLIESAHLVQGDEIVIGPVAFVYETHAVPLTVKAERRVVPAPPGRHATPSGATVATSGTSG